MLGITYENMLCYNETKLKRYVISTASTWAFKAPGSLFINLGTVAKGTARVNTAYNQAHTCWTWRTGSVSLLVWSVRRTEAIQYDPYINYKYVQHFARSASQAGSSTSKESWTSNKTTKNNIQYRTITDTHVCVHEVAVSLCKSFWGTSLMWGRQRTVGKEAYGRKKQQHI
jgi:hypothetical protein